MEGTLRISDLRRPYGAAEIPSWPPRWVPSYDGAEIFPTGEDGILTWVERMSEGPGLWLTMRLDGVARRAPLLWSGPPNLTELEQFLRGLIGRAIRDIGPVEIRPAPIPNAKPVVATVARSRQP